MFHSEEELEELIKNDKELRLTFSGDELVRILVDFSAAYSSIEGEEEKSIALRGLKRRGIKRKRYRLAVSTANKIRKRLLEEFLKD